jgi:hypothetical protein
MVASPGAVNLEPFDPSSKYGPAFAPQDAKIWNPMKKMMQGDKLTGGTLSGATDPATYCAMANAGYDFIWTEMQHDPHDWHAGANLSTRGQFLEHVRGAYAPAKNKQQRCQILNTTFA